MNFFDCCHFAMVTRNPFWQTFPYNLVILPGIRTPDDNSGISYMLIARGGLRKKEKMDLGPRMSWCSWRCPYDYRRSRIQSLTSNQNNFIYPYKSTPKSTSAKMNYPSQKISVSISLPASARQTNPSAKTMKSFPKKDRKDENSHRTPEMTSCHTATTISRSRSV